MENTNKITAGTISRTIILILALINQILTVSGHSIIPIADEQITSLVSVLFTVITALIAWWKNNSFTQAARQADKEMKEIKSAKESE